jgi:hypothetical protein
MIYINVVQQNCKIGNIYGTNELGPLIEPGAYRSVKKFAVE